MSKKSYICDLHIHSIYSDGSDRPEKICAAAKKAGVQAVSITDHDTLGDTQEKIAAAKNAGLLYVTGIEFSAYYNREQVHILGYGIDAQSKNLERTLLQLKKNRAARTMLMLEKLENYYGITLNIGEVRHKDSKSEGSMHIARMLLKKGYAQNINQAFEKYIGFGAKAYCPELRQTPVQAIEAVTAAQGFAVLAHPSKLKTDAEDIIKQLKSYGLYGIEAQYSSHTKMQTEYFKDLAKKYNLITTVGSDYHGEGRSEKIGTPKVSLDQELLQKFKAV